MLFRSHGFFRLSAVSEFKGLVNKLGALVANGGLAPKKHEKPFRHMLADGSMIEGSANPSLEDTAKAVAE